jgi:tetratricopeptide (TPR) repeat protein
MAYRGNFGYCWEHGCSLLRAVASPLDVDSLCGEVAVSVEAPPPARLVAPSPRERAAALIEAGLTAVRNGEIGAAAAAFREASEIAPSDARAWTNLGVVLIRTGNEAGGVEALRWALSAVSDYAEAHRNLRQGRGPEAARHYRAFRSHRPDDVPGRATVTARLEEIEARRSLK